jgi:DNA-binding MarR family transcriptional regulator
MRRPPSRLQNELRQNRPFATAGQEALVGLLRTADLLRRRLAQVIEPRGITVQQYNVLRILRGAGEAGLPTLEIASRMIEQTPGITRLLDRLEAKGLVRRERCPRDRRQILCRINAPGEALLAALAAPVAEAGEAALAPLAEREKRELIRLLDAVRAAGEVEH